MPGLVDAGRRFRRISALDPQRAAY